MKKIFLKSMIVALVALFMSTFAQANEKWPNKIVFSVIPVESGGKMINTYEPLAKHIEKKLGIKVDLKTSNSYSAVIIGMEKNHIDLAYFGPKSYLEAAKRAKAEAIAYNESSSTNVPGYYGVIITKKGSNLKSLENLKGKKWAFTDPLSTSGTLVPTIHFAKEGIDPQQYFSKVHYSGSHEASIISVLNGHVDGASTNNTALARGEGKMWTTNKDFNILWKSELIPASPFAVRGDLPVSLKTAIQGALVSFDNKESLKRMKANKIVVAKDKDFDPTRKLVELKKQLKAKK